MSERDRGDRPKKSWRELDAQRDRTGPRPARGEGANRGPHKDGMDARASKQYRAALDALFEKGEVGKIGDKLSGGPGGGRVDPVDVGHGRTPAPAERPSPVNERAGSERSSPGEGDPASRARAAG